jgi:DNA-binding response OmpR family regulator
MRQPEATRCASAVTTARTLVLVVEDEESISDALSYLLRKEGFQVAICPTGPDALRPSTATGPQPG